MQLAFAAAPRLRTGTCVTLTQVLFAASDEDLLDGLGSITWKNEELWVPSDEGGGVNRDSEDDGPRVDVSQLSVNGAALHNGGKHVKGITIMPIEESKHLKPGWVAYTTGVSDVTRSIALLNASHKVCLVMWGLSCGMQLARHRTLQLRHTFHFVVARCTDLHLRITHLKL